MEHQNLDFRRFFLESDRKFQQDIKTTLAKIPVKHRALVKKYDFESQSGNNLKNDTGHVGVIDEKKHKITVSAPWNYGRGFVFLHEIAHAVWQYILTPKLKKEWSKILKSTKFPHKDKQSDEEMFCMIYAGHYMESHCPKKFDQPNLHVFIRNLPK